MRAGAAARRGGDRASSAAAPALVLALLALRRPWPTRSCRSLADDRLAGLEWRFVRIRYPYVDRKAASTAQDFYGEPWAIDAPAAEQNLSRRLKTVTSIEVEDPIVLTLDDPRLCNTPGSTSSSRAT